MVYVLCSLVLGKFNLSHILFRSPPTRSPREPHVAVVFTPYSLADPHDDQ